MATPRPGAAYGFTTSRAGDDWRHRGACRDEDPELFFPTGTSGPARSQVKQAKRVCRRCPVQKTCLQWAIDSGDAWAVLGGTTPEERRKRAKAVAA